MQLRHITKPTVRKWVAGMASDGLSVSWQRQARQVLHAALSTAVSDGLIGRNPVAGVKIPKSQDREHRYLTSEQVTALAEACESRQEGAGALVRTLAHSGIRWGEAVALRARRVDVLRRRLDIRESATEIAGDTEERQEPRRHRANLHRLATRQPHGWPRPG